MSISLRIEPRGRLVLIQAIDQVTAGDWDRVIEQLLAHPSFEPGVPILVDRRQEDTADRTVSLQHMVELIDRNAGLLGLSKWALVVARSNQQAYHVGRMTMQRRALQELAIDAFVGIEGAVRWLLGDAVDWNTLAEVCVWAIKTAPADRFVASRLAMAGEASNAGILNALGIQ